MASPALVRYFLFGACGMLFGLVLLTYSFRRKRESEDGKLI